MQSLPTAMTSLPIVLPQPTGAELPLENEQSLRLAFRSFAERAHSLETSYGRLRSEVERLHRELAGSRAGLARSLEDNREMRRHLDRILNGLPCGVLVAQPEGGISLLNPEGGRLLQAIPQLGGGPKKSGAPSLSPSPSPALVVPEELFDLLEQARGEAGEQERCFVDARGAEFWLAVRHAAVRRDQESEIEPESGVDQGAAVSEPASIFILRDVTEAKVRLREREQRRREQALAEMAAILAHEVRNPLGSLELFAGLLAEAGLREECREWVEHVQAGLRTLSATVNNVLHFHSLPEPQRVATDLGQVLAWAGGFLAPVARQAGVQLRVRNRLAGVHFWAERHRLEQVLQNLVLNAVRATPAGGWVEIVGEASRERIEIRVEDSGPGIACGREGQVFTPGFSTHGGSPGLGLAVCRKIVEQHGGGLRAANRSGGGACFTVSFPRERENEKEREQESDLAERHLTQSEEKPEAAQ